MASFNRVILMGNLTRDIELRVLPSGMAVSEFAIAVNDRRKTSEGQWVEETSFFDITLYGRTAEVASEYLSKGSPVFIEGKLKQDTWEKDGQKRSKVKVIGERMQLIGGRDRASSEMQPDGVREKSYSQQDDDDDAQDHHVANVSRGSQANHPSSPNRNAAPQRNAQPAQSNQSTGSNSAHRSPQPTGKGPGYDEPEIPF